jgi:hypothetical protein
MARLLTPPLRHVAKTLGYALGSHGSKSYDIDFIACPWTKQAGSALELAEAIRKACEGITGWAAFNPETPVRKPHGRLGWAIHIRGAPYVDLSVMPRRGAGAKPKE